MTSETFCIGHPSDASWTHVAYLELFYALIQIAVCSIEESEQQNPRPIKRDK